MKSYLKSLTFFSTITVKVMMVSWLQRSSLVLDQIRSKQNTASSWCSHLCLCFHRNGRGPPGSGIPVHHNTRGHRSAAVLPGAEPDLPVWSTILEEASQPREGEHHNPRLIRLCTIYFLKKKVVYCSFKAFISLECSKCKIVLVGGGQRYENPINV